MVGDVGPRVGPSHEPVGFVPSVNSSAARRKSTAIHQNDSTALAPKRHPMITETISDAEQQQFLARAQPFVDDPALVRSIIADGCDKARRIAHETMRDVREVMGLAYR